MSKETVNKIIKSCIVSRKGGVPITEIENDYKELVGQSIPYVSLGYTNLRDFIHSIDFVSVKTNYFGDSVLFVSDPKVAHIENLVSKQKNPSNRNVGNKNKRNRKYYRAKSRWTNKLAADNWAPQDKKKLAVNNQTAAPLRTHYENINSRDNYRPATFNKNTRMEYCQSKWYSDRPKDAWKKNTYENRKLNRFNNFNAGRPAMQNSSYNSSTQSDNSWRTRDASPRSVQENMYNFHSPDEKRYAQESRSWRFQLQVANNANPTVGSSQQQTYNRPEYNFSPWGQGQLGCGGPNNNYNYWWRDWRQNPYRDNQSGVWWPGLQGPANPQLTWEVFLEPLINGHQLIGDDFFLQLALHNSKDAEHQQPRAGTAIRCGLCISGQTIDECRQRLEETQFLSGKIAILLGAVDIFRGHSLEKMVRDMEKLLDVCRKKFNLADITLCTIPPLANFSVRFNLRKLAVLYSFNNWIKLRKNLQPDDSCIHRYNVIDLFTRFTDYYHRTLYDYFQLDAKMVSGCRYPHVLWNTNGRRIAISMLGKYKSHSQIRK